MLENKIKINGINTSFKIFGENNLDNLLILHGWGGSNESWIKVGELLGKKYKVIIPDLPGFGKTNLEKIFTIEDYAIFVEDFCKELNLENIILLGHSNGGAISIKLANRKIINIKKLILNNSAGIRNKTSINLKRKVLKILIKPFKILNNFSFGKKIRNIFYKIIGNRDYINSLEKPFLTETYLNMIKTDLQNEIKNIKLETLLIRGNLDTYTPIEDGIFMSKNIENSKLIVLKGEKHGIHLQNPELLTKTILEN